MTCLSRVVAVVAAAAVLVAPNPVNGGFRKTTTAQPAFKSSVEAVRLDVSVMRGGQPVRGLSTEDFVVTDNNVVQRVEGVLVDSLPVSVFLALDTSGSVAGERLSHLIDAGKALVTALRRGDRAEIGRASCRERV